MKIISKAYQIFGLGVGLILFASACGAFNAEPTTQPTIEMLVEQTVQTDCPSASNCEHLNIEPATLSDAGHDYFLVQVHLPFEALADVIAYRLVECDDLYTGCTVVDSYDGEFGVVKIVTDTGQPRLHWEPFVP